LVRVRHVALWSTFIQVSLGLASDLLKFCLARGSKTTDSTLIHCQLSSSSRGALSLVTTWCINRYSDNPNHMSLFDRAKVPERLLCEGMNAFIVERDAVTSSTRWKSFWERTK
jgi:hypothetical protein